MTSTSIVKGAHWFKLTLATSFHCVFLNLKPRSLQPYSSSDNSDGLALRHRDLAIGDGKFGGNGYTIQGGNCRITGWHDILEDACMYAPFISFYYQEGTSGPATA